MNKSDLKNGLVVKSSNGFKYLIIDDYITNFSKVISLNNYNENLKDVSGNNHGDIIEIYKIKNVCCLENILDDENLELLWKREEEIDWENVPKGTIILVRDSIDDKWEERKFIMYIKNIIYPFITYTEHENNIARWYNAKLKEEI